MHISSQSSLYFVATTRSKFITFLLLLLYQKALYEYMDLFFHFFLHITAGRFHISLAYAFRSRWKTNSHFDLRPLLFVMTLIIFFHQVYITKAYDRNQ